MTEQREAAQYRLSNMWKRLNMHFDGDDYRASQMVRPGNDLRAEAHFTFHLWISYDKNRCFLRCGTIDGSVKHANRITHGDFWDSESYLVFYDCFTPQQAKTIKQIIKNVVANAGKYASFGNPV